jgi:hypothetical protein
VTIEEMVEALDDARGLMDDELGEYWRALVQLASVSRVRTGKGFEAALEKEIRKQHTVLKKEFRLVERAVTHVYTEQRLVRFSEEG